jgi:hypothetical protein
LDKRQLRKLTKFRYLFHITNENITTSFKSHGRRPSTLRHRPRRTRSARLAQEAEGAGGHTMRDVAEYRKRAEDCRQQALKLANQPDHWGAFVEMAQTWEQLADLHELTGKLKASGVLLTKPAISAE